ncbi:hypothetical protein [Geotalea sp. SG265]|uniref:hypothetical protein n=1 Tax=Geotalea sp. SG265 TaxID=2922867 RepID=UPI001FAECCFD|nr:hypothetical protein [Geotalea sp. SG265]
MDYLSLSIGFVLGIAGGFIANYLTPRLTIFVNKMLSSVFHFLNPDRYDLTGKWEQIFKEPEDGGCTNWVIEQEITRLSHLGNIITGTGETKVTPRIFDYDLKAKHNMIFGSYKKRGEQGNITGVGMIQLIVSPDRLSMKGQATWFDHDTQRIESSESTWKKLS